MRKDRNSHVKEVLIAIDRNPPFTEININMNLKVIDRIYRNSK